MSNNRVGIRLLCLFLPVFFLFSPAGWSQTGNWEIAGSSDGSTLIKRTEAAFVRVKSRFYLMGSRGIKPISIYDARKNTWTEGAAPPIEIHHFQPVNYRNKIYVIGALTGGYPGETPVPYILIYDPVLDAWSKGPDIPTHRLRGSTGVTVYRNRIYIAAGIKDGHRGDHKNWLDVFDPRTGEWLELPDAPHARDHFQAIAAKGRIYLIGGRRSESEKDIFANLEPAVDVFDLRTGSWSTLEEPLPTPRAGNYLALYGKKQIVVLGGETGDQEAAHSETEVLDVENHEWSRWASMVQGRHGTGAVVYRNKIFVASGCGKKGGAPEVPTMEVFEKN
ncbi:Kelch repeat-containing protein [Flavilitoribacter nigricans]|uniref:Galactose oxidase n=1 Tax=Flavilitoribacter nigricans (strain ATCC 23147 / DSM 23189 / NBRC 102662 / NCIMB 1420 / SS-2) TaxID=1122177 RepID=A0A2D0NIP4_FLAN2|nr:kelch repeat-containing protein [Flavilitoribacter nigricans]PHN08375.1 galactose oxidase [Flavilitoribacter nigricans DSM 23189 = NBRC 102662]